MVTCFTFNTSPNWDSGNFIISYRYTYYLTEKYLCDRSSVSWKNVFFRGSRNPFCRTPLFPGWSTSNEFFFSFSQFGFQFHYLWCNRETLHSMSISKQQQQMTQHWRLMVNYNNLPVSEAWLQKSISSPTIQHTSCQHLLLHQLPSWRPPKTPDDHWREGSLQWLGSYAEGENVLTLF